MADDDVPPLEDMSDLLHQVERLREYKKTSEKPSASIPAKLKTKENSASHEKQASGSIKDSTVKQTCVEPTKEKDPGFGGFKKGFLLGGSGSAKKKPISAKPKVTEDIPIIKPKNPESQDNRFTMPEVQQAMKAKQNLLESTDWVTEDLLTKIAQNKTLMRRLQDPVFMQAIAEFQTDSTKALAKYQNNPTVMEFFKETCGILGDHFTTLSDLEDKDSSPKAEVKVQETEGADIKVHGANSRQPTPEDEQKMANILSKPDVRSALQDPKIQELIASLRTNPAKAQSMIQNACPAFYKNIKTLVDNGLLAVQR